LRRAGVPREAAMRLVNHSSELIHQVYQGEKVEDVAQWRDAVQFQLYGELQQCHQSRRPESDRSTV